jgi:DHA2 family multidrug resistance protein
MPGGIAVMLLMHIAAIVGGRFDRRFVIAIGFLAATIGIYHLTSINLDITFRQVQILRVIQVIGLPFISVNITTLNYVGIPPGKSNQVSGLSSFTRNIGGAVGVSISSIRFSSGRHRFRESTSRETLTAPIHSLSVSLRD